MTPSVGSVLAAVSSRSEGGNGPVAGTETGATSAPVSRDQASGEGDTGSDRHSDEPNSFATDGGRIVRDEHDQHPLFLPIVFIGGLVFGFGLAYSHMAQPEVVLSFLQFVDFGLLFVMFGAAGVTGIVVFGARSFLGRAPLTGRSYGRRLKELDRNVILGGGIFGVGWGLSGICPGAAYASLGIGNLPILWGIVGMFVGAYVQGVWRSMGVDTGTTTSHAD